MGRKKLFANTDLVEMFPYYADEHDVLDCIETYEKMKKFYITFFVSVFDHWLTAEEFGEEVTSRNDIRLRSKRNNPKWEIYQEYENRFSKFYDSLYKKDIHVIYENKHLIKMASHKEYKRYYLRDVSETCPYYFQQYVVPSLGVKVKGAHDLTHIVHANPKYFQKEEFEDIVKKAGLHILPNAEINDEN